MAEEKFVFSSGLKKRLIGFGVAGLVLLVIGILLLLTGGGHHTEGQEAAAAGAHHEFHWYQRLYANLWINNVYFTGISIIGVFFVAINYVAHAGWSAVIKRVPEAFGAWLPFAGVLMLVVFLIANHDLFHWTHEYLYDETDPRYDALIAGKEGYLNFPFYLIRMVLYFGIWYFMYWLLRRESLNEDLNGGTSYYYRSVKYSAIFLVIFAVTSSTSAWDWILSIDTHWFSTMIGWYVFASWFVTGLAAITLTVVVLKENGYLTLVTSEHLHDLGKFVFAFSIFWTYIWFSQFMLIYYANIPEETIYFVERLSRDQYAPVFFINLILNFFFPFLVLMTRDSKRHSVFLKLVCIIVLVGHWLDFYLMVTPGTLKDNGGFGFMEIGLALVYGAAFVFVILTNMSKASLVAVNHPMLGESTHHHT
jgi:hypothetical protein